MTIGGEDADQLVTDVISLLERSIVKINTPAPFLITVSCLECVEDI